MGLTEKDFAAIFQVLAKMSRSTPHEARSAPRVRKDPPYAGLEIGKDKLLTLYRQMVAIRLFEERSTISTRGR